MCKELQMLFLRKSFLPLFPLIRKIQVWIYHQLLLIPLILISLILKFYRLKKKKLKRKLEEAENTINSYCKRIRALQQSNRRTKKKISNFTEVVENLKKENLVENDALDVIRQSAGVNTDLLMSHLAKLQGDTVPKIYSPQLRAFALTLHFYSVRAYDYVREVFNNCLPHNRTISRWYTAVEGTPGFSSESLDYLKQIVSNSDYRLLFSLIMDEMAIRQHVEFDGKVFHGYINCGTSIDNDDLSLAKEALVFMIVGVNSSLKMPVGYFLIDSVNSSQKVNLVNQCYTLLNSVNVEVISFTFDGCPTNLSMARQLGCNFDKDALKTNFCHPVTKSDVYVLLDPCHMLKLVRNTLGGKKSIDDE